MEEIITIAVVGSRSFNNYRMVVNTLDKHLILSKSYRFVSGGACGADRLAERYAKERDIPMVVVKPEWGKYGRSAGYINNTKIVEMADMVIAFWNGTSPGTKHAIKKAEENNKKVILILARIQ
jgi:hypothetical protein